MERIPSRITVTEEVYRKYTMRIGDIVEMDDFEDEFAVFDGATMNDTIILNVTSGGGSLYTCNMLTKAIRETQAHTMAHVGALCASAATAVVLSAREWTIDAGSSFMIHTGSLSTEGKTSDLMVELPHRIKMMNRWVVNTYTGFLTEEEIDNVIHGRDYWIEGEELGYRLEQYAQYRANLQKELDELNTQA